MNENDRPLLLQLGPAFTNWQAEAIGIHKSKLSRMGLESPIRGIYYQDLNDLEMHKNGAGTYFFDHSHSGHEEEPNEYERLRTKHREIAIAFGQNLSSDTFFTRHTAAVLWHLPVNIFEETLFSVGSLYPTSAKRMRGVESQQFNPEQVSLTSQSNVSLTTPACTWAHLAENLDLRDLVAVGDAIVREHRMPKTNQIIRPALASIDELKHKATIPRRRAKAHMNSALDLISSKSASVPETHLRLLLHEAGFPVPLEDVDIYDQSGNFIGCSELAYPDFKVALEYEGDHHRHQKTQWNRDIQKYRDYQLAGWFVFRVTSHMLYLEPEVLLHKLAEVLRAKGA